MRTPNAATCTKLPLPIRVTYRIPHPQPHFLILAIHDAHVDLGLLSHHSFNFLICSRHQSSNTP